MVGTPYAREKARPPTRLECTRRAVSQVVDAKRSPWKINHLLPDVLLEFVGSVSQLEKHAMHELRGSLLYEVYVRVAVEVLLEQLSSFSPRLAVWKSRH